MNISTDFRVLLKLAYELGQAEKVGEPDKIAAAKKRHDEYKDLCLQAERMELGCTYKDLL